jgi:putative peptide zinc metalloprotease protein
MVPATLRFRFRPDLICEQILFGGRPSWVVKDPVAGRLFYFNEREYSILGALDGRSDLHELLENVRRRRPDEYLSPETLIRFLADARKSGLITARGGDARPAPPESKTGRFQLLSAQWPLFNPQALLAALTPDLSFVFTRGFLAIYLAVLVSAALSIVVRFEDFTERLPAASAWFTPTMVGVVAVVLFACKMLHELGHGVAATRFGARVEECGVVFLFFMPCFYCDVSGAWLFRSRDKRILVSAAGMLVELGLAAGATWLWWFSRPGPVQTVCLAVMTTCSVNTLLINGNPLMRFDGYFILVDLLGLPNLAARSTQWWAGFWSRWFWGLPASSAHENDWRCALYGALSAVYRVMVVIGVLWFMHRAGKAWGLAPLTIGLAVLTAGGIVVRSARTIGRPLGDSLLRRMMKPGRVSASLLIAALLLGFLALKPFPRSIETSFVLEPDEATPVFAVAPGQLLSLVEPKTQVAPNDIIAVLRNLSLERDLVQAETDERLTASRLESAQVRRNADPDAARAIPALTEALAAVRDRRRLLEQDVEALTIRASVAGTLLPPPNVVRRASDPHLPSFWTGTPFDSQNVECFLERGTLIGQIAETPELSALAFVNQRDVERLKIGQRVRLAVDGAGDREMSGTVVEISASPVERVPRELVAGRQIVVRPESSQADEPLEPHYQVRIHLDAGGRSFIPGAAGLARIEVADASLLRRLLDALHDAFRFEAAQGASSL